MMSATPIIHRLAENFMSRSLPGYSSPHRGADGIPEERTDLLVEHGGNVGSLEQGDGIAVLFDHGSDRIETCPASIWVRAPAYCLSMVCSPLSPTTSRATERIRLASPSRVTGLGPWWVESDARLIRGGSQGPPAPR